MRRHHKIAHHNDVILVTYRSATAVEDAPVMLDGRETHVSWSEVRTTLRARESWGAISQIFFGSGCGEYGVSLCMRPLQMRMSVSPTMEDVHRHAPTRVAPLFVPATRAMFLQPTAGIATVKGRGRRGTVWV